MVREVQFLLSEFLYHKKWRIVSGESGICNRDKQPESRIPYYAKKKKGDLRIEKMPPARIELATFALQVQRSTTKLRRRIVFSSFKFAS